MNYYNSGTTSSSLVASDATSSLDYELGEAAGFVGTIVSIILILQIVAMWKIFVKAGEKGWKSLIPIYNYVVLFRISGVSPWLLLTVFANIIPGLGTLLFACVLIYQTHQFSKSFGKGIGTTILLLIEPFSAIIYLMLGFGSAEYVGPGGVGNVTSGGNPEV